MNGLKELDRALTELADLKGAEWKREAMTSAAIVAMKPVLQTSKSLMPVDTGYSKRSLRASKPKYNLPSKAQVKGASKRGQIKKGYRHELIASIDYPASYGSKGKKRPYKYGYAIEVGVKPQTYIRTSKNGVIHHVNRTAARVPVLYMHKALARRKTKVVSTFKRDRKSVV